MDEARKKAITQFARERVAQAAREAAQDIEQEAMRRLIMFSRDASVFVNELRSDISEAFEKVAKGEK